MLDALNLIVDWLTMVVGICAVRLGFTCGMNGTLEIYEAILLVLTGCFALTIWHRR